MFYQLNYTPRTNYILTKKLGIVKLFLYFVNFSLQKNVLENFQHISFIFLNFLLLGRKFLLKYLSCQLWHLLFPLIFNRNLRIYFFLCIVSWNSISIHEPFYLGFSINIDKPDLVKVKSILLIYIFIFKEKGMSTNTRSSLPLVFLFISL